ncbi:hypothetical protein EV424DRAFT_1471098 [Suillus variegatus]|nr:hypothetical protein EV424DRAFT_1471098 [Suillus variegatus]
MDELVHHCLRELSFDGDLGCNVSRLRDFIVGFHSHDATHPQVVDDAFCAFVWSIVVQQPTIRVGTVPPGVSSEVHVAPQTSAKRKAAAKGEVLVEEAPPSLTLVENARDRSLEDLKAEYGEDLRIAVDPGTSFAAITGSHIRSSKLSPMVYSALQFITRGREEGVSTVELGRKTKYDQKTCFYVIKQLLELGLIIKARRGGVGNHSCIHRYFVERSAFWQQIQQEEAKDDEPIVIGECHPQDAAPVEDGTPFAASELDFEPVDARHLSSLPLIKNRIVKLLKASPNNIHASNNLIITIGFMDPTKTDRRFFETRLRELIAQGVIERVLVPSFKVKDRHVKCIRLVAPDSQLSEGGVILAPQEGEEDDKEIVLEDTSAGYTEVRANRTIQKQVSDVLEEAGPSGRTLREICSALGNFDRRTIELLLTRAVKSRPPAHLSDLGTADFMESFGRERRHRYYTVAAYTTIMASEKLDDTTTSYANIDLSKAGDFAMFHEAMFYDDDETLHHYEDMFKGKEGRVKTGAKKRKRPETEDPGDDEAVEGTSEPVPKPKRGRPRKKPRGEEDGISIPPKKRVQPRKNPIAEEGDGTLTGPGDEQHRNRQAVVGANVQAAVSRLSDGVALTTDTGDLMEYHDGLVAEGPKPQESCRKPKPTIRENGASSSPSVVEGLPGGSSDDRIDESEVVRIPPQVVDGSRTDRLFVMDKRPSEPIIIDPALLRTSSRSRIKPSDKLKTNTNISHLRRENEFFRVIQDFGGIVNLHTKHFFDAHIALLNDIAHRGEPASAPSGTRIDKRTADATIKNMESRGRVKVLKTTVFSVTGSTRPASLVYLPDTPQEKINAFLHHLSHTTPTFEEPVDFGASSSMEKSGQDDAGHQVLDTTKAEELFSYDSETIRDVLLTERTTVAQLYGFRVGKAARLRDFHVFTLGLLEQHSSPRIASREHSMIDISLYQFDVPLATYCSFIAVLSYDEELSKLMASVEGKETLIGDLPNHISAKLQVGKLHSKSRVLELLDALRLLGLVTPYEPSTDDNADFTCTLSDGRTVPLKAAAFDGWRVSAPSAAPQYWRFNETAPLHLWALSDSSPSYWRPFWDELHKVCRDVAYVRSAVCPTHGTSGPPTNTSLLRFLRRRASWDLEYRLTWHQKRYLDQSVDRTTARSPLDDEDIDSQLQQICHVLSAPRAPVVAYLKEATEKVLREMKKARARQKRDGEEHGAMQNVEAKTMLQKKAEEAKLQRESDWEALLQRVHPGPLKGTIGIRIRAVHSRFIQSSSIRDQDRWQSEIENAIREARLASNKVIARPKALAATRLTALPPVAANPPEKSVHFLIAQQGPPILTQQIDKSRGKTPHQRRSRFHWTREYDELARDASAVIRARCRSGVKIDLSALDQVFPAVPRNSVRLRLSHLRENTGEEVYMARLEDRWHDLWVQHRGTEHLPDEDPQSPSNFDIVNHIEFLRKHVDKNALRVGYVEHTTRTKLPASVDDIIQHFDVLCNATISPACEFVWQAAVEEGREKQFLRQSFTHAPDDVPYVTNTSDDVVQVAEAALKMVFGMSSEHYDADLAAEMLHSVGDQSVSLATSNLLRRGVLSKVVRDPKKMKPGRTLKISEVNLNAIGGSIHGDLFQDAVALDEVFAEQVDSLEWPLLASDGDIAALLQLVSEEQVNFIIDTAQSRNARTKLDWNSKKADDNDIETSIQVRLNPLDGDDNDGSGNAILPSYESSLGPTNTPLDEIKQHGKTVTGADAAYCVLCTELTFSKFIAGLDGEQRILARNIFDRANASPESGLSKSHYLAFGAGDVVMDLLQRMSQTSPPLILWAGYSAPVIISCLHARPWTVEIMKEPKTLALPRRWLDIRGGTIRETWNAILHAVTELRWRLRAVCDRQEFIDILCFLYREEAIYAQVGTACPPGTVWPATLDDGEEQQVFWFIGKNKYWYQV